MTRFRRRLVFVVAIAMVIVLAGGTPVSRDRRVTQVVAGDASHVPVPVTDSTSADVVASQAAGAAGDFALAATSAATPETVIKTAPTQFQGEAPKPVAPPARANSTVAAQGNRGGTWAVVIGVNDYPGSTADLDYAVNDAHDVAQALTNFGVGAERLLVLRDGQVSSRTLLSSVNWLATNAGPDSAAVFFYAGHVRKTPSGNEEIVTSDGSTVSDGQLAGALSRVRSNRSWVGIAACFGGGFTEVLRPGRVLTGAADANSLAYENSALGRSYMVEYMIRQGMLQNRASATVQTAFNYAVDRISREKPGREPVQFDQSNGALDLRTSDATASAPPPAPEPQPHPEPGPNPPPADEPPASNRPGEAEKCARGGLLRRCTNR